MNDLDIGQCPGGGRDERVRDQEEEAYEWISWNGYEVWSSSYCNVNVLHTTSTMEELLKNQIRMTQPVEVIKLCSSITPVLDYGHMKNGYMAGMEACMLPNSRGSSFSRLI